MKYTRITEIVEGGVSPPIVTFQNGIPNTNKLSSFKCDVFKSKNDKKIVCVNNGDLLYSSEVQKDNILDSFVCVLNKESQEIKLVPVDYVNLRPVFKKRKLLDESALNKSTNRDLSKTFGSKKSKRATEQTERLKMDVDNIKKQLEETVSSVLIKESDLVDSVENTSEFCPKINRDATDLTDVYNISEIIPLNILNCLENDAKNILDENNEIETNLKPFVKLAIANLRQLNSADKVERCKLWLYVNKLATLLVTNAKMISHKNFKICENSPQLNEYILNNFTQLSNHGRMRPMSYKDKTLCFILVLTMIASGYKLNLEQLAKDLQFGVKKLAELCRILCFTPTANKSVFTLKLPLPAPFKKHSPKKKKN